MKRRNHSLVLGLTFSSLVVCGAQADITIEHKFTMQAGGFMAMLASDGEVTTMISGDRSRSDTKLEPKSGFMKRMAGNANTASITRLDQEVIWQLMPDKQRYSEMSFDQMRAQMQESMQQLEQVQQNNANAGVLPVSDEDCRWTPPEISLDRPGAKQRFAGVKAEQHVISVRQTCTVPQSGQSCEVTYRLESWLAKKVPNESEARAFQTAMAKRLGLDRFASGMQPMAQSMLSMFKDGWEEAAAEFADLRGYPMKTVVQLQMGGEQCTTAQGQPIAMDDVWSAAGDAAANAAINTAAGHAGSAVARKTAEAAGNSIGGQVAGSAVGAAAGSAISGMFNKLRKKKKKKADEQPAAEAAPASAVIFSISQEVSSISTDPIASAQFEIPAGWTKTSQ